MSGKSRSRSRPRLPSVADLVEQRDSFIQTFFKKGAALTEELLREDEQLRDHVRQLEAENARLRAQIASDDAIRDLAATIERLEQEKHELLSRFSGGEPTQSQYPSRFAEIEAENAKLASLYVASYQLHSSLDLRTVVRRMKEILGQFVGARAFAIYLADHERGEAIPIASEGVATASLHRVREGVGAIGAALASGHAQWVEGDTTGGSQDVPVACIPLRMDDLTVGIIAVFATYEQKPSFVDVDFELFRLLGAHAAAALAAARLFAVHGGRITSVEQFVEVQE